MQKATYKDSGVDLEIYQQSMARLPGLMSRTRSPRVLPADGGFAGLFQLDFPGKLFSRNYQDPVLVACTDGVGTKLKAAQMANAHKTVGIDLVAMCVNDALCCGGEPLFFLDYVAMGKDDPQRLADIVEGISHACSECDMSLIGGETAIMPDLYQADDYDLAGFCVGVVDRAKLIDGKAITPGDQLIGVASSGLHSNGYSLVRKIVFDMAGLQLSDHVEECDATVEQLLLEPTQLYVRQVRSILSHYSKKQVIHGIAHITGGGLYENVERILPPGIGIEVDADSWPVPPVFSWLQELGNVDQDEMQRVFNNGIGLVLVVSDYFADSVQSQLTDQGLANWKIGRTIAKGETTT